MSQSNSSTDTVLLLSVGKSNSCQKKYPNLKRYIKRWFRGLKTLPIQKKIIYFLIIMICCLLSYQTYHNQGLQQYNNKANEDLDLEDSSEINHSYDKFEDASVQNFINRNNYINKIRKMKSKI